RVGTRRGKGGSCVVDDASVLADVVASELGRLLSEALRAGEGEQALDRRLEVVAPAHGEVEALAMQRDEAQAEPLGDGAHAERATGRAIEDCRRQVGLA